MVRRPACYSCTPGSDASFAQLSDAGFPQAALVLLSWAWLLHRRSLTLAQPATILTQPHSCVLHADAALRDNLEHFLGSRSAKGSVYVSCSTVSASLVKVCPGCCSPLASLDLLRGPARTTGRAGLPIADSSTGSACLHACGCSCPRTTALAARQAP